MKTEKLHLPNIRPTYEEHQRYPCAQVSCKADFIELETKGAISLKLLTFLVFYLVLLSTHVLMMTHACIKAYINIIIQKIFQRQTSQMIYRHKFPRGPG